MRILISKRIGVFVLLFLLILGLSTAQEKRTIKRDTKKRVLKKGALSKISPLTLEVQQLSGEFTRWGKVMTINMRRKLMFRTAAIVGFVPAARIEVKTQRGSVLFSGQVKGPLGTMKSGKGRVLTIDFGGFLPGLPPTSPIKYYVRVTPQDTSGNTAGKSSPAVVITYQKPSSHVTQFTDEGLKDIQSNSRRLKTALAEIKQSTGVPALAATVVKYNAVYATASSGVRRLGQSPKVTDKDDMWQLGSITKVFTKDLVRRMLLIKKNMSWNTRMENALPSSYVQVMHANLRKRTIKEVADHTAGLANSYEGYPSMFPNLGNLYKTREKHIKLAIAKKPPFPAGEFHYSNFGYVLLSAVAVTNSPYPTFENAIINKHFKPSGITKWYFGEAGALGGQVWPHTSSGGTITPVSSILNTLPYNTYAPAGHISLSISDCNKLLRGYMKRGGYNVGGFDGSNGRNYARTHINTGKGWAYMICTNVGGDAGKYAVTAVQNWINANFK
jgi:CubicO group peptidase (beta-lactamase class C family)